ncbi:MAG: glycosyltransferase family 39 protein [Verrucomicrobiota bacterium]
MFGLQHWIHHWSAGRGAHYLKFLVLLLGVTALAVVYDFRAYRGFATIEAMDTAQLARNLAEGKGYTTLCIRPFSLCLLQKHANQDLEDLLRRLPPDRTKWTPDQQAKADALVKPAQLTTPHPDISNPPGYPFALAGLMLLVPFEYTIDPSVRFQMYQPELVIAIFNQILFFLAVWMLVGLARRLLDDTAAWFCALTVLGSELWWRFTLSGHSTVLLLVIFLGIVWCLVWLEHGAEQLMNIWKMLLLAVVLGGLAGAGMLTRYAFGWLLIPVLLFMGSFLGTRRLLLCGVTCVVFCATVSPWLARNYELTGTLFGTAGYSVHEGTYSFPDTRLVRSADPDFSRVDVSDIPDKLLTNLRTMVTNDLPRFGGSWVTAFFLVGLLLPFKSTSLSRLRYFLAFCLLTFILAQCLGRTHLSEESPEVNSENLLIILAPLVFLYGTALFFVLVSQSRIGGWEVRPVFMAAYLGMAWLPLGLGLSARTSPVAYPPYNPPVIQTVSHWMQPGDLMMSDMPWAVAWYGHRTCLWLSLNSEQEFQFLHKQRRINALYLTARTLDNRFITQWVRGENQGWGAFIAESLLRREVPEGFPLTKAFADLFPEQLFLADRARWKQP